jgi:PAS domain S-box-containing protein
MVGGPAQRLEDDRLQIRVGSDGVITHWGAELKDVFGYEEGEVLGRKVDFLIPRMLRALHWRGFNKALATGKMHRPNKTFRSVGVHKDGHHVGFRSIDVLNFAKDGSVEGVTGIILRHGWRSLFTRTRAAQAPPRR